MPVTKEWPREAERELWADICTPGRHEHSLWWFVRIAAGWHWRCTFDGELNWLTDRVHRPWLDWLQEQTMAWKKMRQERKGEPQRYQIVVCVPRGFGKSNIVTKCLPLWAMLDEPNLSAVIGSEVHPKAKAFLKAMKAVINGEDDVAWFTWLYGNWYSPDRDWNKEEIDTAYRTRLAVSEPSISTFGVETGITSKHPLLVIYDDPVSKEKLKEGGNWLLQVLESMDSIYPALRPDSMFLLIGTRYLDDDPIGTLIATEGVAEWEGHPPLDKIKDGNIHVFFLQARDTSDTERYPKGRPVLPEAGWGDAALTRYENRNAQEYSAQMMNDPARGEHMELTKEQIEQMLIERKDLPPIEYATLHLDTAFKDDVLREKGDPSAINVWLHDLRPTGVVYFDGAYRDVCRSEQFDAQLLKRLFDLRRRGIRVRAITMDKEVSGYKGVYAQRLEQVIGGAGLRIPEIIELNRTRQKEIRIRIAAGYWVDGFVRLIDDAENRIELEKEMLRIGRSKFDDLSDASSDVFLPQIWRGRHQTVIDEQPDLPRQPGDDILKDSVLRELFPDRYPPQTSDPQPELERAVDDAFYRSKGPFGS